MAAGDQTFEAVFRAEFARVVRLAYTIAGSNVVAQDAAQEAFTRLYERFDSVTNPAGFVRTVAINRLRDRGRSIQARDRALNALPNDSNNGPVDPDYLADVLGTLTPERRAMVVLRFYEQWTVPEIAEILDIPQGTVKSGLARSLAHLRERLT